MKMEGPAALNISDITRPEEGGEGETTSVIMSIFFLLLSPAWYLETDTRRGGGQARAGSSYMRRLHCQLPVFGLYLVTVASTSIILSTLHLTGHTARDLTNITLLAAFSVCGLLHIALFYINSLTLLSHRNISQLGVVLCFLLELILLHPDQHLLSVILCCLAVSVVKLVHTTTILNFALVIFTMAQGTWLLHSSFLPTSDSMTNLYFSWHILAVFVVTTALNILSNIIGKKFSNKKEEIEESQKKKPNLTETVKKTIKTFDELNVDILQKEKILVEPSNCKEDLEIMKVLNSIDRMVTDQALTCEGSGDNKVKERISPLEEFNALFRNVAGVRKSIKLKESGIV